MGTSAFVLLIICLIFPWTISTGLLCSKRKLNCTEVASTTIDSDAPSTMTTSLSKNSLTSPVLTPSKNYSRNRQLHMLSSEKHKSAAIKIAAVSSVTFATTTATLTSAQSTARPITGTMNNSMEIQGFFISGITNTFMRCVYVDNDCYYTPCCGYRPFNCE